MKVAIHQPEHFPYLGFFQKMEAADLFIILDDVKFTKNNFQNRNKFLNSNKIEEWFTIELEPKAHRKLIKDIVVSENPKWKKIILSKLKTNFKKDFSEIYNQQKLLDINLKSIEYCKHYLNISTPIQLSSQLNIKTTGSKRLADICDHFKADEYISGMGGKKYLDESLFKCKVSYFIPKISNYYTTLQNL